MLLFTIKTKTYEFSYLNFNLYQFDFTQTFLSTYWIATKTPYPKAFILYVVLFNVITATKILFGFLVYGLV